MEMLKRQIKETLEKGQYCLFTQKYKGHEFCYLLTDICENQSDNEYIVGIMPNRINFRKCKLNEDYL